MKMTTEIRTAIETIMNAVCGGDWFETGMSEEMCGAVCEQCPYYGRCREMGIMWVAPTGRSRWARTCESSLAMKRTMVLFF